MDQRRAVVLVHTSQLSKFRKIHRLEARTSVESAGQSVENQGVEFAHKDSIVRRHGEAGEAEANQ